jgi:hypothetical protein
MVSVVPGSVFGSLTVVGMPAPAPNGHYKRVPCICVCGRRTISKVAALGSSSKCASCAAMTHGHARGKTCTLTYRSWTAMHDRCKNNLRYVRRGISICDRWSSFENFLSDVGERPSRCHTLDRIDNDRGYAPDNCRWATYGEQGRNRACSKLTTEKALEIVARWEAGERMPDIARALDLDNATTSGVIRGTLAADVTGLDPLFDRLHSPTRPGETPWLGWREEARRLIQAGWPTFKAFCDEHGVSQARLSNLLSGRARASSIVPKIGSALGMVHRGEARNIRGEVEVDRRRRLHHNGLVTHDLA